MTMYAIIRVEDKKPFILESDRYDSPMGFQRRVFSQLSDHNYEDSMMIANYSIEFIFEEAK